VALVGEVVSSGDAALERLLKAHLYADAGIPWYLLAEVASSGSVTVRLLRLVQLDGGLYVERLVAADGEILSAGSPFAFEVDTGALAEW
jgi:hypothetical protein